MRILFITLDLPNFQQTPTGGGIYASLIRELSKKNEVYTLCQAIGNQLSGIKKENGIITVRTKVPFLSKNKSLWKKGIGSLLMNVYYIASFNKYLHDIKFDYIILPTPPPTMVDIVQKIKAKTGAKLYVILRDIQPECANRKVVLSLLENKDVYDECKKSYGINSIAKKLLHKKSQLLYKIADKIGCMSPGNVDFVKTIAPYVPDENYAILPNWYDEIAETSLDKTTILKKYDLNGKYIAIFGGNIGPQQAIWNIATLAKHYLNNDNIVFLVIGKGTKLETLKKIAQTDNLNNIRFVDYLPSDEYNTLLQATDLGIISLDEKYIVPTCPSKIIGYMALAKPVIAMFNEGSDYGDYYIDRPRCGVWSTGLDHEKMFANFDFLYENSEERVQMGLSGFKFFKKNFTTEVVCSLLEKQLQDI